MRGARAARKSILEAFPQAEIRVMIVWIDMRADDREAAAQRWAQAMHDRRVRHFHDPQRRAGKAIARSLGAEGVIAWDIYLIYAKGSEWADGPPAPIDWMHQLQGSSWADPARYHRGPDLVEALREAMQRLLATES